MKPRLKIYVVRFNEVTRRYEVGRRKSVHTKAMTYKEARRLAASLNQDL